MFNFLETVKKPAVKDITYRAYLNAYKLYILPYFKGKNIAAITREDCQAFINSFAEKQRTAQIAYQLISVAFRFAVQDDLISKSPMAFVKLPPREQAHGKALTYTEEKELIRLCMQDIAIPAVQAVLFVLYTGIRRSELASATINENFVIVENAKLRKGRRQTARNIPITPMLRKVLPLITPQAFLTSADTLTRTVKKLLPLHHCHELRHTFISRCKECEVLPEVVSIWAGHTLNGTVTTTVYTHYSEDFMLKEAAKVNYAL